MSSPLQGNNQNICPFLTGNSEVKCGFIELGHREDKLNILELLENDISTERLEIIREAELKYATESQSRTAILLNIPSFLIPQDFIQYLGPYLELIISIKTFRHYIDPEKYLSAIKFVSKEALIQFIKNCSGNSITSLDSTKCCVLVAEQVIFTDKFINSFGDVDIFLVEAFQYLQSRDSMSSPSAEKQVESLVKCEDSSSVSPASAQHAFKSGGSTAFHDLTRLPSEEEFCPVCLEPIDKHFPSSFTTCCGHSFHTTCAGRLSGPQCPVCRFSHDSGLSHQTECLICIESTSSSAMLRANTEMQQDLWVCIICGFTGCGKRGESHIDRHYESTLHTYAMNVYTRNVWDFAGDGYVHRLILNVSESSGTPTISSCASRPDTSDDPSLQSSSVKIVEVSDSRFQSQIRLQTAPLTSQQEELIVNRKLEDAAQHYNQLLAWQMATQRDYYELQLARLQSFLSSTVEQSAWVKNIVASLHSERTKILKQIEVAKKRGETAKRELDVTVELNKSMIRNLEDFTSNKLKVDEDFRSEEIRHEQRVNELQTEIDEIMQALEATTSTTSSSSSSII